MKELPEIVTGQIWLFTSTLAQPTIESRPISAEPVVPKIIAIDVEPQADLSIEACLDDQARALGD